VNTSVINQANKWLTAAFDRIGDRFLELFWTTDIAFRAKPACSVGVGCAFHVWRFS
jgi:hypothetical protein